MMKKGTIFFILIILVLGAILGYKILNNKDSNYQNSNESYNIAEFIDYINSLDNVYLEIRTFENTVSADEVDYYYKVYIKDDKKKMVKVSKTTEGIESVLIYDFTDNTSIVYKDNKGAKISGGMAISKPYINLDNQEFTKVYSQKIDGREYIVGEVSFAPAETSFAYFDKDTKLLLKQETKTDSGIYQWGTNYDNIKLNIVTDNDFVIPSSITIEDNTNR